MPPLLSLALALLPAAQEPPREEPPAAEAVREAVPVEGTFVRLVPPEGFVAAEAFAGFELRDKLASVVVMELAAPLAESKAVFDRTEELARAGIELLDGRPLPQGELEGFLFEARQTLGPHTLLKWLWLFGDEERTVQVVGTLPEEHSEELSEAVRAAVLSAEWDAEAAADPFREVDYELADPGPLRFTTSLEEVFTFNESGERVQRDPDLALLTFARYAGRVAPDRRAAYCETRLKKAGRYRELVILSHDPIRIDELPGIVSRADAVDLRSGEPVSLVQVMLFDKRDVFVALGAVGVERREEWEPILLDAIGSFRRKPADAAGGREG